MGYTRSGSTLLDTILGSADGFFSTGELHYLWERGLVEGRRCGCGRAVSACPLWTEVLARAFPDGMPEPSLVIDLQRRVARTRFTPLLLRKDARTRGSWAALNRYAAILGRLYEGIASVTGARVVVDSSKRPSDAAITRLLPSIDPYVVQLVRDPRAVVHSWSRRKPELDRGGTEEMPRQSPLSSALGWVELNAMSELVRRRFGSRGLLLRYEDLVADLGTALGRIYNIVGTSPTAPPMTGQEVDVRPNHTVSGNPGRFAAGGLDVRPDDAWRSALPPSHHALTTAVTLPLLVRYHYPLVGRTAT